MHLRYWVTSLETMCEELYAAGFLIERLWEPRPGPGAAAIDQEDYALLQQQPGFIALRAIPSRDIEGTGDD